MLAETIRVGKSEIFTMPESEELKQRIQKIPLERMHHISGKKTKGHGGS